ncbi:bacterial Ig-like domain-containing protein [bacterium]|nr:bacterial Ig-like domain-containing protein [bacterium]
MSKTSAFTLVEILLAIVLIGIISTIIYTNLAKNSNYEAKITKAKAFATSVPLSLPTSFLANWKLEGSGSSGSSVVAADLLDSWSNNSGTSVSGATILDSKDCMFGKCILFDGTGGIATGSSSGLFNGRSNWTLSAWIKPDSDGGKDCFYSEGNGSANIFSACVTSDNNLMVSLYRSGRVDEISTNVSQKIERGKWNYVVISLEKGDLPGALKFWINGDLVFTSTSQARTDTVSTTDIVERIGVGFNSNDRFKGAIDDIQVYSDYVPSAAVAGTIVMKLVSIAITTPASKLNYAIGETIDINGLVVTGTYSDSSTKVESLTADNITGFNSSNPAENQTLTINISGKTTTYGINVIPAVPQNLACGGATGTSISCSWDFVSGTGITYKIRRNNNDANTVTSSTKPIYDTGLTCNTSYSYEISACIGSVCSNYSASTSASTSVCPPPIPTNFACIANSSTEIACSWTGSSSATTYELQRNGTTIQDTSAVSKTDSGLTCGTSYDYQVRAKNAGGESAWVATSPVGTTTNVCVPDVPSTLTCTGISASQIDCSWSTSTNAATYELQRNGVTIQNTSATTRNDTGILCNTYNYQVRACNNAGGCSEWKTTTGATSQCYAWTQIDANGGCSSGTLGALTASSDLSKAYFYTCNPYRVVILTNGNTVTYSTSSGLIAEGRATTSTGNIVFSGDSDYNSNNTIYKSTDYGVSWTKLTTPYSGGVYGLWARIATSSDASRIYTAAYQEVPPASGGRLFTSTNQGSSWTELRPNGDAGYGWIVLNTSTDGSRVYAGSFQGNLYTSSDYGNSWTLINNGAYKMVSSSDGSKLLLLKYVDSRYRIYKSSDYGSTWTEVKPAGDSGYWWYTVAMSNDGTRMLAGINPGSGSKLYQSLDSGATWVDATPVVSPTDGWVSSVISNDGTKAIVLGNKNTYYGVFLP